MASSRENTITLRGAPSSPLNARRTGRFADGIITVGVSFGDNRSKAEAARLTREILEQVRALPGVVSAGATNALPLDGSANNNGGSFAIRSRPRAEDALPPVAMYALATDGLHETMRTPLREGRALLQGDAENQQAGDKECVPGEDRHDRIQHRVAEARIYRAEQLDVKFLRRRHRSTLKNVPCDCQAKLETGMR